MAAHPPGAKDANPGSLEDKAFVRDGPTAGHILVVEDDDDDFFLTERVLRKFGAGRIQHVDSGRAAIDYLAGNGAYADRRMFPVPSTIFLDLKLDQVSGHDVLRWVGENLRHRLPKIFVLTGSNEPRDRELVKTSGAAAGYVVKPLTAEQLKEIGLAVESPAGALPARP